VKNNQPSLYAQLTGLPWRDIPAGFDARNKGHGRAEWRTLKLTAVAAGIAFPHAAQAIQVRRRRRPLNGQKRWSTETSYAITSLAASQATPAQVAGWVRGHWGIEALHHIRDVTYGEDASQIRTGNGPEVMAALRNLTTAIHKLAGARNIAAACRHHARDATRTLTTLGLSPCMTKDQYCAARAAAAEDRTRMLALAATPACSELPQPGAGGSDRGQERRSPCVDVLFLPS
jgi:Transposase DDE domain